MAGISEASGQDVGKMMENWLSKTGFPLITVEETEKGLKVRQNRFFATADATVSTLDIFRRRGKGTRVLTSRNYAAGGGPDFVARPVAAARRRLEDWQVKGAFGAGSVGAGNDDRDRGRCQHNVQAERRDLWSL